MNPNMGFRSLASAVSDVRHVGAHREDKKITQENKFLIIYISLLYLWVVRCCFPAWGLFLFMPVLMFMPILRIIMECVLSKDRYCGY